MPEQRERQMLTITEAIERAHYHGLNISAYTLRKWVISGEVPSVNAGRKYLIYYPNLVSYLTGVYL